MQVDRLKHRFRRREHEAWKYNQPFFSLIMFCYKQQRENTLLDTCMPLSPTHRPDLGLKYPSSAKTKKRTIGILGLSLWIALDQSYTRSQSTHNLKEKKKIEVEKLIAHASNPCFQPRKDSADTHNIFATLPTRDPQCGFPHFGKLQGWMQIARRYAAWSETGCPKLSASLFINDLPQ